MDNFKDEQVVKALENAVDAVSNPVPAEATTVVAKRAKRKPGSNTTSKAARQTEGDAEPQSKDGAGQRQENAAMSVAPVSADAPAGESQPHEKNHAPGGGDHGQADGDGTATEITCLSNDDVDAAGPTPTSPAPKLIIYKDPRQLKEHPQADRVPNMDEGEFKALVGDMKEQGFDPNQPIDLLPDGVTVWDGRQRRRAAIQNNLALVPCVVTPTDDVVGEMYRRALLRRHLTDDQRAFLARAMYDHLSQERKTQRARKAGMAAAAKQKGILSSGTDDKNGKRREALDTRKDVAHLLHVPENKFKGLAKIEKYEREHKVPAEKSKLPAIRDGLVKIGQACGEIDRKQEEKALAARLKVAKAMTDVSGWRHGDCAQVLRGLDAELVRVRLLILDPDQPDDVLEPLKLMDKFMLPACSVFAFATFRTEPLIKKILQDAQYTISGRFIWDMDTPAPSSAKGPGDGHMSIIWATRGEVELKGEYDRAIRDVLRHGPALCDSHPDERPVSLMKTLIEYATVEDELVMDLFGGIAPSYIAARQKNRRIIAIEANEQYYLVGRSRIEAVEQQAQSAAGSPPPTPTTPEESLSRPPEAAEDSPTPPDGATTTTSNPDSVQQ